MPRPKKKYTTLTMPSPVTVIREAVAPRYMNVRQLADYLGLPTPSAARRAAQKAGWKTVKVGIRFTYDKQEIDAWWAAQASELAA
jgi:hypothetical protein